MINNMRMLSPRRRNTIKMSLRTISAAAVIIYGFTAVLLIKSTYVVADRDAYLQEKYLLEQLKSRRKGGFFRRKKTVVDNDPAVKYQRQRNRSRNPVSSSFVLVFICLAALWVFGFSTDTVIVCISGVCSQISELTGSFAQQHNNDTSRRRRDRNNNNNNSNNGVSNSRNNIRRKANANNARSSLQNRNASDDNSISPSVLEIIDMETIVDDSPKPRGMMSSIFDAMFKGRKNIHSSSKQKNVPDNNLRQNGNKRQSGNSSNSRSRKSHRDKSSLRLRASTKQSSIRKDEELGDDDESNIALPGVLNSIEEDEYSDNGTAFAIGSPETKPSPKREKHSHVNGHSHTKTKAKSSPLKKKLSDGMDGEKKSNHHHSSRRRKHHH